MVFPPAFQVPPILVVVVLVIVVTYLLMFSDKITTRLAIRNISRRKITVVLVICGLLIGAAMISGSLVTQDTMNNLFSRGAYFSYGAVDEGVYYFNTQGGYGYFNYSVYDQLRAQLLSVPNVAGVTPETIAAVSLFDNNTRVGQPGVVLVGVDPNATSILGSFADANGNLINPNIGQKGAIINHAAARDLNASVGDVLLVISAQSNNITSLTIRGIDYSFERSGFPGESDHVIVTLPTAESIVNQLGRLNFIAITNSGGITQGILHTRQVGTKVNSTLSTIVTGVNQLYAFGNKNASVVQSASSAQMLGTLFLAGSSFAVLAGVMLIVNIFVMLAEERKQEMGMARAIGMKRRHLTKLFLFEGTQYSIASSAIGVAAGVGIAYAILYVFGKILINLVPFISIDVVLASFTFTPQTLITAFSAGLLITYITILFASWRVSKLNIIRAIRNIPEPPRGIRTYTWLLLVGIALLVLGGIAFVGGATRNLASLFLVGPAISIFGVGLILTRFVKNRYAFTAAAIALLLYWGYPPLSWNNPSTPSFSSDFTPFLYGGVFMVVSGVLLVIYNSDLIMKIVTRIGRAKKNWVPVFRIGLSYPGSRKFRTGGALLMFALVMFTIVVISMLTSLNQAFLNQQLAANSGGYDLIATTASPVADLTGKIRGDSNLTNYLSSVVAFNGGYTLAKDMNRPNTSPSYTLYVGANSSAPGSDNFFNVNTFNMTNATSSFLLSGGKVNAQKVWRDIQSNPTHVVLSVSLFGTAQGPPTQQRELPGDIVSIALPNRTFANVTIVAIMSGGALNGLVTTSQFVQQRLGVSGSQYALLSLTRAANADRTAIIMKRDFLKFGMQVLVLQDLLAQVLQVIQSFFSLFQGFLGLGLVVGIAGLGIIAVRAVVERRQEIGMLRALGFTRTMVLGSFLLENSFIALLGILIGVLLGIDLGYAFATAPGFSVPFVIPYMNIIEITTIAYAFAMLGTIWSAFRASKIPPAEALRYIE